jgi:beta-glucosidase/6-phospho-beta-glucosidase/beta-galactosidase
MIQEIHKSPFNGHITNSHYNGSPEGWTEFSEPLKKTIIRVFPVYKTARYVYENGIHADDFKKEGPFFITQHINYVVEERKI